MVWGRAYEDVVVEGQAVLRGPGLGHGLALGAHPRDEDGLGGREELGLALVLHLDGEHHVLNLSIAQQRPAAPATTLDESRWSCACAVVRVCMQEEAYAT